jgi:hypothetical protein
MLLLSAFWSLNTTAMPNDLPPPTWDHCARALTTSKPVVKRRAGVLKGGRDGPKKGRVC